MFDDLEFSRVVFAYLLVGAIIMAVGMGVIAGAAHFMRPEAPEAPALMEAPATYDCPPLYNLEAPPEFCWA